MRKGGILSGLFILISIVIFIGCDKTEGLTVYTANPVPPAGGINLFKTNDVSLKIGQIAYFEHHFSGSVGVLQDFVISNTNVFALKNDFRQLPESGLVGGSFHGVFVFEAKQPGTTLFYIFENFRGVITYQHTNMITVVEK
ncbi:MAG: hypothetical protein A2014_04170 [Spirochaetes bacterium GWF1_49_6]|nr:MAG: hypothetical protein A2014_04170 [Spirochaetes bacterium GWF1_49_6]